MPYIISEDCMACGICANECPSGAIVEGDTYHIDLDICIYCGTCASVCPSMAIQDTMPSTSSSSFTEHKFNSVGELVDSLIHTIGDHCLFEGFDIALIVYANALPDLFPSTSSLKEKTLTDVTVKVVDFFCSMKKSFELLGYNTAVSEDDFKKMVIHSITSIHKLSETASTPLNIMDALIKRSHIYDMASKIISVASIPVTISAIETGLKNMVFAIRDRKPKYKVMEEYSKGFEQVILSR